MEENVIDKQENIDNSTANEEVNDEKEVENTSNDTQLNKVVEVTTSNNIPVQEKVEKKSYKKVILILAIVIVFAIVALFVNNSKKQAEIQRVQAERAAVQEYNSYIDYLNLLYSTTLSGAGTAESVCVLTLNVWQDAIYGDSSDETKKYVSGAEDFNEALNRLYADEEIQEQLQDVYDAKEKANKYIMELQTCPSELSKAYDVALETNTAFSALADLALSPEGSYNSFSEAEADKVDDFITAYKTLAVVIPAKTEVPLYDRNAKLVEDQFVFDIYLNQLPDKLPSELDDRLGEFGTFTGTQIICGVEGEITYSSHNGVISFIEWEIENPDEALQTEILEKLREKYGEESIQDDTTYSWSDNLACNLYVTISDEKIDINWMTVI